MTQKAQVTIYTDGGCEPNPGLSAYAAILQSQTTGKEKVITDAEADTTNYRMELMAVAVGLEALKRPAAVTVVCDNDNVVKGAEEWLDGWIANEWRNSRNKPVEHADLWERIHRAMQEHEISFLKVKAHVAHNQASEAEKIIVRIPLSLKRVRFIVSRQRITQQIAHKQMDAIIGSTSQAVVRHKHQQGSGRPLSIFFF